jgi:hypothetical protein
VSHGQTLIPIEHMSDIRIGPFIDETEVGRAMRQTQLSLSR